MADAIDLSLPVMDGIDEDDLHIVPGRVPRTANIGEVGNAVIAGHREFEFGSQFNRLGELESGDIISFTDLAGHLMQFEVFETIVVYPGDQIAFVQPDSRAVITLYTCTPIETATHRLLVRAEKIN